MPVPNSALAIVFFGLLFGTAAGAPVTYLEDVQGPLSGSSFNPTALGIFEVGTNVVDAGLQDGTGPNDVFTFEIGASTELIAITLASYTDENNNPIINNRFFFGIHDDVVFPVDEFDMLTGNAIGNEFLGGFLLGNEIGVNMLPLIGNNNLFIGTGFTGPLGPGSYTVFAQQTDPQNSQYNLEFQVAATAIPEPSSTAVLACLTAVALTIGYRRRRKISADKTERG